MTAVLGIDAAWTERQPSGVALVRRDRSRWRVVCVAPSCASFVAASRGAPVDWLAKRVPGSRPDVPALLAAARRMTSADLAVVAVDMPLAKTPIACRRSSDRAISKAFGGRGCSTHSPSALRPGPVGHRIASQLEAAGFPLCTSIDPRASRPCAIEVYPHPALLALLARDYRVPYKVARAGTYWPGVSVAARVRRLLAELGRIHFALEGVFGRLPLVLPDRSAVAHLSVLKRYEDALDALVCAWVGVRFLEGAATAFGDESSAIWVPEAPSRPSPSAAASGPSRA